MTTAVMDRDRALYGGRRLGCPGWGGPQVWKPVEPFKRYARKPFSETADLMWNTSLNGIFNAPARGW